MINETPFGTEISSVGRSNSPLSLRLSANQKAKAMAIYDVHGNQIGGLMADGGAESVHDFNSERARKVMFYRTANAPLAVDRDPDYEYVITDMDLDAAELIAGSIEEHNDQWDAHPAIAYSDGLITATMNLTTDWQEVGAFNNYDWPQYDTRPYTKIWAATDEGTVPIGAVMLTAEVLTAGRRAIYAGVVSLCGKVAAGYAEEIQLFCSRKDRLDDRLYLRMHNALGVAGRPLLEVAYTEALSNAQVTYAWKVLNWRNMVYA